MWPLFAKQKVRLQPLCDLKSTGLFFASLFPVLAITNESLVVNLGELTLLRGMKTHSDERQGKSQWDGRNARRLVAWPRTAEFDRRYQ